jgi:hypothetical protein
MGSAAVVVFQLLHAGGVDAPCRAPILVDDSIHPSLMHLLRPRAIVRALGTSFHMKTILSILMSRGMGWDFLQISNTYFAPLKVPNCLQVEQVGPTVSRWVSPLS